MRSVVEYVAAVKIKRPAGAGRGIWIRGMSCMM